MSTFRSILFIWLIGSIVLAKQQVNQLKAQEINPIEAYVLNRGQVDLSDLFVAGTNDYYYYRCLDLQHREQLDEVDRLLVEWTKKLGRNDNIVEIEHRQSLLKFPNEPAASIEYWKRHLGLQFNHVRQTSDAERNLPRNFDNQQIANEALLDKAFSAHPNSVDGIETAGLFLLKPAALDNNRNQSLLQRLSTPDYPDLVDMILREMQFKKRFSFGELSIHKRLTVEQLDSLAEKKPEIINQQEFVRQYLLRLAPNSDVDIERDAKAKRAYLVRMLKFTERLNAVHNSLRANILNQLLVLDKLEGIFDRARFMRYLDLPRNSVYIRADYRKQFIRRPNELIDFNLQFADTIIKPLTNDQGLIQYFLAHYLAENNDLGEFQTLLDDDFLKRLQAEINLLNGTGSAERWANVLGPEATQALTKRVDLEFSPTTPKIWKPGEPIELKVSIKNVPQLVLKVFEINSENYYRQFEKEIATDLQLDGLVPTVQEVFEYDKNPILKKHHLFKLDSIKKPGVYIVDLIGNGVNSRALIRIGQLNFFVTDTIAGHQFTVLDQDGDIVNDASIWFGGKDYKTVDRRLLIPYSTNPGRKKIVIKGNDLASLGTFDHKAETYELDLGIHVDREMLVQHQTAKVLVRPSLKLNGATVTTKLLEDANVSLSVFDHNSGTGARTISSTTEAGINGDFVAQFVVPEQSRSIKVSFTAKVKQLSTQNLVELNAGQSFGFNKISDSETIEEVLLVPSADGYYLEVRGKSGEPIPNRVVTLKLKHQYFIDEIDAQLMTDESGKIGLGPLAGIEKVTAAPSQGATANWKLGQFAQTVPTIVHSIAQVPVVIPYAFSTLNSDASEAEDQVDANEVEFEVTPEDFALFEMRSGSFVRNLLDHLTLKPGRLTVTGLNEGNYQLFLKNLGSSIEIRVSSGELKEGLIVGASRILESQILDRLSVREISRIGDKIQIQVEGALPTTRVHLFATRFHPAFDANQNLMLPPQSKPTVLVPGQPNSSYVEGRDIGEEMRYILDRQLAKKYTGNMLPRPSLLLNPWALRTTDNKNQTAAAGEQLQREQELLEQRQDNRPSPRSARIPNDSNDDFSTLDFLLQPGITLANLRPDENGLIVVPITDLEGRQYIRVLAVDHENTFATELVLPAKGIGTRDLRLADGLDPEKHFSQEKNASILNNEEQFTVAMSEDPQVTVYASLADLFDFYLAKFPNSNLEKFEFLKNWSTLSQQEKQEKYSEFACHELHFFIYQRDRNFFDETVLPYLRNKFEKTFLDRWFLEEPLEEFTAISRFNRLNTFEKILLAQRMDERRNSLLRTVVDRVTALPLDRQALDANFAAALGGLMGQPAKTRLGIAGKKVAPDSESAVMEAPNEAFFGMPEAAMKGGRGFLGGIRITPSRSAGGQADKKRKSSAGIPLDELRQLEDRLEEAELDGITLGRLADGVAPPRNSLWSARTTLLQRLYRPIQPTSEWLESNYFRLNPETETSTDRCPPSRFWKDYAEHVKTERTGKFLSANFMHINGDLSEVLLALSILDLPETALEHPVKQDENQWNIQASGEVIILAQKLMPNDQNPANSVVLLSENYFRSNDRYYTEDGNRYDKFVTDEFLSQTVYGAQVVVTNPTSTPRQVELLTQIPNGSLPVEGSNKTKMVPLILGPFESVNIEYKFYFPKAGEFSHFPAHVTQRKSVLAAAQNQKFVVVETLSKPDSKSWNILSQDGSDQEVLEFLETENLQHIDLKQIAFRMKNETFFGSALAILRDRQIFDPVLWSYGIQHSNRESIAEYLHDNERFINELHNYFVSDWFQYSPVESNRYQHREYWPLVNSRFHQLGNRRKLLNTAVFTQYSKLLELLSHKPKVSTEDRLALVYYLFLQDRISEGLELFDKIATDQIRASLQLDYLKACVAIYRDDLGTAKEIASQHLEHPVSRWKQRFRSIATQIAQSEGKSIQEAEPELVDNFDNEKLFGEHTDQSEVVSGSPTFEFQLIDQEINLTYQNLSAVSINYYVIDLEQLFSQSPFSTQENMNIGWVKPNRSEPAELDSSGNAKIQIPTELANRNLLVEVRSDDRNKTLSYFSRAMSVQIAESFGQLQVSDTQSNALPKTYIKVYGKRNGQAIFLKDGYTDFRGRFDYVSQSNVSLDGIDEIAILVSNEQLGAQIKVVKPPQR